MKKFLSVMFALNLMLAVVCYATTSHAETVNNSQEEVCGLSL